MKARHQQILEFMKEFYMENGYCPSIRQIGDGVGLKSTSSVMSHIEGMEKEGLIVRSDIGSPRSIRIPGFNYNMGGDDNKKSAFNNVLTENETVSGKNDTVFVLHGHWSMPGDEGVEVWGVSLYLDVLSEIMEKTGNQMVEEARSHEMEIEFDSIETSGTKYEAENAEGYYIRIYITEHKVLKGSGRLEKYYV